MGSWNKHGVPVGAPPVYTDAALPAATAVPDGFVVWNSTYKVLLRSNGTDWEATGAFVAAFGTPSDTITQTAGGVEIVFRAVDISAAVRYAGKSGAIRVTAIVDGMTADGSSKFPRIRYGETGTPADLSFFSSGATNSVGSLAQCYVFARNSVSAQISGNNTSSAGYFSANSAGAMPETSIDHTAGSQFVTFSATLATVGQNAVLRLYRIVIEPGYV